MGLALFHIPFIYSQNNDILTDIMNGQFSGYEVINQSKINTPTLEFSPCIYLDSLVYVANGRAESKKSKALAVSYFNLYISGIDSTNNLIGELPFSTVLNSVFHEGPLTFNKEGTEVFFTRNNQIEGAKDQRKMNLSIYTSKKVDGIWLKPTELFPATSEFSFCHPALNKDGTRLYFSSNLPGGYGNYDLYYIERAGDMWTNPVSLGAAVNTGDNELFPTFIGDQILTFCSNRPNGIGGLDIYVSELKNGAGQSAQLLPAPVNSPQDDISLVVHPNLSSAYFTSSRPGGAGQDDIYALKIKKSNAPVAVNHTFIAIDSASLRRLGDVTITVSNIDGKELYTNRTDRNGSLVVNLLGGKTYKLLASAKDFQDFNLIFTAGGTQKIKMRSSSCVTIKGIALDQDNNSVMRDVEIRLVQECNNENRTSVTDGYGNFEFCIPQECDSRISASIKDYYEITIPVKGSKENMLMNLNFIKEKVSILKEPVRKGGVITLENIYFDFNTSTIREGAERELNELTTVLHQHPNMVINLIAHTDSRGDTKSNLTLSISRAKQAKSYLLSKGIAEERITIEGRGETQIRNRCKDGVNCTEDEHQFNRRIEVVILKL